jgi:hypothetical protein
LVTQPERIKVKTTHPPVNARAKRAARLMRAVALALRGKSWLIAGC